MKWPWSRPEVRSANYTDQVISQILSSAGGAGDGGALAAIEASARLWGSGLASATVKPDNIALQAITPTILDSIGRNLCRVGECLFYDRRAPRQSIAHPCGQWTVHGNDDPGSWLYRATLSGPDSTRMITLPSASVAHFRYSPHPSRPWAGRSPLTLALDTFSESPDFWRRPQRANCPFLRNKFSAPAAIPVTMPRLTRLGQKPFRNCGRFLKTCQL